MTKLRDDSGQAAVLLAVTILFLLAFLSLSLDAGRAYVLHMHLQQAVDMAALNGAVHLPTDPQAAETTAQDVLQANGVPASAATLSVSDGDLQLNVQASRSIPFFFAPLLGISQGVVSAKAAARVGNVEALSGLVPLGVVEGNYVPGQTYELKAGAGQGTTGNYGAVWFGDGSPGADTYRADLENGCPEVIHLGEQLWTEPGDMVGPTDQGLEWRLEEAGGEDPLDRLNPRLLLVPVITPPATGRSEVTVVGFAAFLLQSVSDGVVTGTFLQESVEGPAGPLGSGDYGLKAVQLVE